MKEFVVEITPSGMRSPRKTMDEVYDDVANNILSLRYIVVSELRTRIFDKVLGVFWLLLEPILMAGLYYFLTVVFLGARVEQNFFLFIYVSMTFWRWFSRTFDAAPGVFNSNAGVIKQTNFSAHLILISFVGVEFILFLLAFVVLSVFLLLYGIVPSGAILVLPLVVATQFAFTFALVEICSVAGTFFKDLSGLLYAFTSIWFYLSPGIYPISRVPANLLWLYNLNPFAHILPAYRDILLLHQYPPMVPLMTILLGSLLLCVAGYKLVTRARYHFFLYL